jgi:[ribosomal protein S18]-alanine N-acetyltransferase
MKATDVDRVIAIADELREAPHWQRQVYVDALDPDAAPGRIALVAEQLEAGIVGFGVTVMIPPQAELETIAVVPAARRQGIASLIIAEIVAELKKSQITEVMLEVRESNRGAQALYRSLGFVETGRRRGYYADPQEDAVLFRRFISSISKGQSMGQGRENE